MTKYASSTDIDVHLRDIDRGNHVNNAVLVSYLQQARIEYLDTLVNYLANPVYIVVATLNIKFERPITWKETVTIDLRIPDIGTSSFLIEYRARVDDETAATADTRMVTFDRDTEESIPIPDTWLTKLRTNNEQFRP